MQLNHGKCYININDNALIEYGFRIMRATGDNKHASDELNIQMTSRRMSTMHQVIARILNARVIFTSLGM